ncbi:uncharacterized protein SCHCODRAFT_02645427 [Schizophyllum commune H4-8]|uniref:uncharacterized protein n=1 Tax=Schizophyllum commune (strain H4-8 / FGSC 9210) TaxID=578458 RepID=UPI00215F4C8A|nr:uncharacterized protein SCHCODRAFT_02645427 [Schizophyllum commune H4-8]KAI5885206.1 hypothetical protein SCHCODRAFT_02645427 [Schizophyllum commune H4-8]
MDSPPAPKCTPMVLCTAASPTGSTGSSQCSDLVGCTDHADAVAPAEERTSSSQSHTCKTNHLNSTHLPLIPRSFPL